MSPRESCRVSSSHASAQGCPRAAEPARRVGMDVGRLRSAVLRFGARGPMGSWRRSGAVGSVPGGDGRAEAGVSTVPGGWRRASRWRQAAALVFVRNQRVCFSMRGPQVLLIETKRGAFPCSYRA